MLAGGKYELAGVAAENPEWRTYEAREVPAGRAVLVHQILEPPSHDQGVSLKELAGRCTPGSGGVLERFASEGVDYIVTEASEMFRDLRAALERAAGLPAPAPKESGEDRFTRVGAWRVPGSISAPPHVAAPAMPVEPAPAAAELGQFTRMFQAPVQPSPPGAPPAVSQPGGFTSMFQTPAAGQTPSPPAPPVSSKPGEFTSMFHAQTPAPGTPSPSPPPVRSEPGSFTKMFQSPASASPAPPSPPQATSKPGNFTQFFQSSLGSAPYEESKPSATPHVVSPPPAPPPGEYTRLFQTPAQQPGPTPAGSGATNVFVTPSVPSPQPAVPMEEGPSDFTRMIQARPQPPAEARPAEAPKTAVPAPAAAPGVPFVLIILFTALAVIAIGLVLFFALRH